LALLTFGNVLNSAAKAYDPSLRPSTRKICEPIPFHPADLAISSPYSVFVMDVRLGIGRIERLLAVGPKPFHVVGMHALDEVLDRYFTSSHLENFVKARVPPGYAAQRIELPPSEFGCIEGELQLIFARLQVMLRCMSARRGPSKLRHERVHFGDWGCAHRHRATLS